MSSSKPVIVVLCGSTRFEDAFIMAHYAEEHDGRICLTVPCFKSDVCCKTPEAQARLDELHRHKIDLAGEVLVIDCDQARCASCKSWWQPQGGIGGDGSSWRWSTPPTSGRAPGARSSTP
jgi:hypothetical protein